VTKLKVEETKNDTRDALCLTKHQAIKSYLGSGVIAPLIL
jgi:hypothetical protein